MTNEPGDRVARLFEAALRKEPSERSAFLDGISEFDPDLRKEVESLLAAEEPATVEKSNAVKPLSPDTKIPDRIGPYHTLREIGEGGMVELCSLRLRIVKG